MREYLKKLKSSYLHLAAREQRMVGWGSILALILLVYAGIWSPWVSYVATMRQQIQSQQATLSWMQAADAEIKKHQGSEQAHSTLISPVALINQLQKRIDQAGLASSLTELKQTASDALTIRFQKVNFDKLMGWLAEAMQSYNLSVTSMRAVSAGEPGVVNVDIVAAIGGDLS